MNNPSSDEQLRRELNSVGARDIEVVALTMDANRGLAALKAAKDKGVEHPVAYAIKLFDSATWSTPSAARALVTNTFADVKCKVCDGHRMVLVSDDPFTPYAETWAPCAACNGECDTAFYRTDGTRLKALPR